VLRVRAVRLGDEELLAELVRLTEATLCDQGLDSKNGGLRSEAPPLEAMIVRIEGEQGVRRITRRERTASLVEGSDFRGQRVVRGRPGCGISCREGR
jgi:hypothetical protein